MNRTFQPHEFAKRAGVTIRALHHYDRLGLLKPSGRTAAGYRLYTDRDLVRLEQIVALKFIGFPLSQIRELLNRKDLDVVSALREQRRIIAHKRDHLEHAIRAIERAEQVLAAGEPSDWEPFRKIIEVIQMQTRKDWMKKYYTEEQLDNLRKRWSPEVQAESERGWNELARDTEAAIARGESPESEIGHKLAERRQRLLNLFTGGDPGIEASLQKLYADEANWPKNFKRPFSEAVNKFLCDAAKGAGESVVAHMRGIMDLQIRELFQQYERANATSDVTAIGELYGDTFMFCGPHSIQTVKKEDFLKVLPKMKAHFSGMGLSDSQVETVEASALDSKYVLAKVAWKMTLRTTQGDHRIDALATYVLVRNDGAFTIIAQIDHQDLATVVSDRQHARLD